MRLGKQQIESVCFTKDKGKIPGLMKMKESHSVKWFGQLRWPAFMFQGAKLSGAGRDHHKEAYTIWMAGGGIRGGISYGETDDFGYYVKRNPVLVRDLHATILHALGMDHEKVTFRFQGLDQRLTGTEEVSVPQALFG